MLETSTAYDGFSSYLVTALSIIAIALMGIYTALLKIEKQKMVKKFPVKIDTINEMSGKLPILGHLIEFVKGKNFLEVFRDESLKNKTFKLSFPCSPPIFITSDPAIHQRILQSGLKEGVYQKPRCGKRVLKELLGNGIFLSDGKEWQRHRMIATPLFTRNRLQSFIPLLVRNANILAGIIRQKSRESPDVPIDMQHYFFRYTLDSFCELGFGVRLNSMAGDSEFAEKFFEAFEYVTAHTENRMKTGEIWRIKEFFVKDRKYEHHVQVMDDFLYSIIAERKKDSREDLAKKSDLLSHLLSQEQSFTDVELRDWIMNLMIAGRDTTALTLTWSLFELCKEKNNGIVKKLIDEMCNIMNISPEDFNAKNVSSEYLTENLDYEFQKKQRYLHKVFQETLRLYPPIPINAFETVVDDVVKASDDKRYLVKKGTVCIYSSWTTHRHPDNFEDPLTYNPDRFDNPVKPFSFLSFNAGPRICLGQEMAYIEAKIIFSCLFAQFEFQLADEEKVVPKQSIILMAEGGLPVFVKDRQ